MFAGNEIHLMAHRIALRNLTLFQYGIDQRCGGVIKGNISFENYSRDILNERQAQWLSANAIIRPQIA